jgi:two-component system chemotaxis response regulator CheB
MIKVLIVDDSATESDLLAHVLNSDPDIKVVGRAASGAEALKAISRLHPDVVTMDSVMPVMDGFEATRLIMESEPLPVILVSSPGEKGHLSKAKYAAQALYAGAVTTLYKPVPANHREHKNQAFQFVRTVKAMAGVKVVKRWDSGKYKAASLQTEVARDESRGAEARSVERTGSTNTTQSQTKLPSDAGTEKLAEKFQRRYIDMVAIGISTGGPPVLQSFLQGLQNGRPSSFTAPLLIVQHMSPGFLEGLREWLQQSTGFPVCIAKQDELPLPGHAYLAPDDVHMGLSSARRIVLSPAAPENGLRPAVSFLFRSVAEVCPRTSVGILLTGMGRDGAAELKLLRDKGALTFAQDAESSLVHGMPGEAIRLGAAQFVLPPDKIAEHLRNL